ncbi:MAG: hypothetical protein RLZZ269_1367 [Actinomycetota bacterium]
MKSFLAITRAPSRLMRLASLVAVVVSLIGWSTGSAHGSGRDIVPLSAPNGALGSFSPLGTGADDTFGWTSVWSIAKWGTNRIVAGGQFRGMGGVPSTSAIAVWNGSAWSALGSGFDPGDVYSVGALDDDTLVAAVFYFGGALDHVYEWNGSTWVLRASVNSGLQEGDVVPWNNSIAIGGAFTSVTASAAVPANHIALLSEVTASALGTGLTARAYSLARWSNDKLVVGGNFTSAGGVPSTSAIAVWDGNQWSALGGGTNDSVRAIAPKDDHTLVVGGLFDHAMNADGTTVSGTARIAIWNSSTSAWSALGSGLGETWPDLVRSIAVDSDRDLIYASGPFRRAVGGVDNSLKRIGVWDEGVSEWIPLRFSATDNGVEDDVMAIVVDGARVYLGGDFANAGGIAAADRIAMWTWDPPQGSNVVSSLPATLSATGFIGVPATGGVKFGNALATYTRVNSTTITVTSIAGSDWNGSPISVDGVGGWGTVGTCGPPLCPHRPVFFVPTTTTPPSSTTPPTSTTPSTPTTPPAPEPDAIRALPTVPESTPLAGSTGTTMSPGEPITVTYGGFTPGEIVHLWVNSTPQLIGTGTADSTGSVTITGSIPTGLPAGSHSLVLYAPLSGTGVRQSISVVPATLPVTGTDGSLVPLAVSLLLAGVISRRLRRTT